MTKFIVKVIDADPSSLRRYNENYIIELYKNAIAKDDESSKDEEPLKPSKDEDSSSDDESSDDESSDEEEKPSEGTEIPDVQAALANVIAGSKIGNISKTQSSVIKCLGLMSSK